MYCVHVSVIVRGYLKKGYYHTSRNFSEDVILALLARLFSSPKLSIANNASHLDIKKNYEMIIKSRENYVSLIFETQFLR